MRPRAGDEGVVQADAVFPAEGGTPEPWARPEPSLNPVCGRGSWLAMVVPGTYVPPRGHGRPSIDGSPDDFRGRGGGSGSFSAGTSWSTIHGLAHTSRTAESSHRVTKIAEGVVKIVSKEV